MKLTLYCKPVLLTCQTIMYYTYLLSFKFLTNQCHSRNLLWTELTFLVFYLSNPTRKEILLVKDVKISKKSKTANRPVPVLGASAVKYIHLVLSRISTRQLFQLQKILRSCCLVPAGETTKKINTNIPWSELKMANKYWNTGLASSIARMPKSQVKPRRAIIEIPCLACWKPDILWSDVTLELDVSNEWMIK